MSLRMFATSSQKSVDSSSRSMISLNLMMRIGSVSWKSAATALFIRSSATFSRRFTSTAIRSTSSAWRMLRIMPTARFSSDVARTMTSPRSIIAALGSSILYRAIWFVAASIMSRVLSRELARAMMSSRSIGVMNVLFSISKTVWTSSSPRCSMSLICFCFAETLRKSRNSSCRACAPSATVAAICSRRSKNCRSCGTIHPFNPIGSLCRAAGSPAILIKLASCPRAVSSLVAEVHAGRLELLQELLPHLAVPRESLDRLAGHLVVSQEFFHLARGDARAMGDALHPRGLHELRVRHLLVRHRVHDDLEPSELDLRPLYVFVLHLPGDAGNQGRELAHGAHVGEHVDLFVHLVEGELPRHDLLRELLGPLLVDRLLGLLQERLEVPHPEEARDEPRRLELLEVVDFLPDADEEDGRLHLRHSGQGAAALRGSVELRDDHARDA